jgi:CheY-like chemotaxis protein
MKTQETTLRILVVEDNQANIEAAFAMLADHDLTVISNYDDAHLILSPIIDKNLFRQMAAQENPDYQIEFEESEEFHQKKTSIKLTGPNGKTEWDQFIEWDEGHPLHDFILRAKECRRAPFDVVLTDVMIPKGGYRCMSPEGKAIVDSQGEMPYGPIIALRALQAGVQKVGILTAGNHHNDPFVFTFDGLSGFSNGDVKVCCSQGYDMPEAEYDGKQVKNWKSLLERLME